MTKFNVYDNDKPATLPEIECWKNNSFNTYEEAFEYARQWLNIPLPVTFNMPADYSGYGDIIDIREENYEDQN